VNIWLTLDHSTLQEIAEEYSCMSKWKLCEAEFATLAKEKLFKGESRRLAIPGDRQWRAERLVELFAKPSSYSVWDAPPIISSDVPTSDYQFNIRPDCAYWLSLRAFNQVWRDRVEEHVHVVHDRSICPYFSVEFKCDDADDTVAENQIASAGALAL
jgi:hypothetical protein